MLYAIFALLVIILDQWVKFWVAGNIAFQTESVEIIPGILSMVNVHNTGAAFSIMEGANASYFFIGLAVVVALVCIILLATKAVKGPLARLSLVFVMAGGLGNCIDRILYGYVQDMFRIDAFNFAIFNVADIFIVVFAILFIFCVIFGRSYDEDEDEDEDYDYDDEDEEDDEEDEDEEPEMSRREKRAAAKAAKREAKEAKKAKKTAKQNDDYYDEDEDEDEEDDMVAPSKRPAREEKPSRRERQQKLDDDYEQFKAARAARNMSIGKSAEPTRRVSTVDPENPFAEWELPAPNQEEATKAPAVKVPIVKAPATSVPSAPKAAAPATRVPAAAPKAAAPTARVPVAAPKASVPTAKVSASKVPAIDTKKSAATEAEEFNLDDILAEFR